MRDLKFTAGDLCLYAVTDRQWLKGQSLSSAVRDAISGGVTLVQLREKNLAHEDFKVLALEVKAVTDAHDIPLIINDSVDLALDIDAAGVHLGQDDHTLETARQRLGQDKTIGVSVHTVSEAKAAEAMGADYIGVGAVFKTGTKADVISVSHQLLTAIVNAVHIPVVAIGGIQLDRIGYLKGSGISGIAVVSALFAEEDIRSAAVALKKASVDLIQSLRQTSAL